MSYKLQATSYKLRVTSYKLQVAYPLVTRSLSLVTHLYCAQSTFLISPLLASSACIPNAARRACGV